MNVPNRVEGFYHLDNGRVYPSVTTILKVIDKSGPLTYWAAEGAATAMTEAWLRGEVLAVKDAIAASLGRRDAAGKLGNTIHSWINALKAGTTPVVDHLPEGLQGYGKAFLGWCREHQPVFLESEKTVFSDVHKIAGTLDALCTFPRREGVWLLDFKTSKGIYPEMALQTAAYKVCVNEGLTQIHAEHEGVVHLKADGNYDFPEVCGDFEAFLAFKRGWEWQQGQKNGRKK